MMVAVERCRRHRIAKLVELAKALLRQLVKSLSKLVWLKLYRPASEYTSVGTSGSLPSSRHEYLAGVHMPKNKSLLAAASLLALLVVNLGFAVDARAGYTYKVLHTFMGPDGSTPGSLIFDGAGNLYGVAVYDGKFGNGNVFRLTRSSRGVWTQTALYSLKGGTDGSFPDWVVFDSKGNLIVVCRKGGAHNGGAIFRLTPSPVGQWKKTVLYDFEKFPDVSSPEAVAFDHHGNLYGNAAGGDINGGGSIFKLTPVSHGRWKLSVVHRFSTTAAVGFSPSAPVMDVKGNFYGTTLVGGTFGYGGVFNLTSDSKGWHLSILHILAAPATMA
jgi:hypothetical protein